MRASLLSVWCLLAASAPAAAAPVVYELDPDHSFVYFEVRHFGTSTLRGRLGPVHGRVVLDHAAGTGELGLRIATASVDTGAPLLDSRLRGPEIFDSARHPEAFFVASRFRFEGTRLAEVRGEFTLRSHGEALSLHALRFSCRPPRGGEAGEVCGGDFEAEVRPSDFGIPYGEPIIGNVVRLLVQAEGRRR